MQRRARGLSQPSAARRRRELIEEDFSKTMKTIFLIPLLIGAGAASAFAQDFRAPLQRRPQVSTPPEAPRIIREGGLNRGARKGSVVQMFNPFAPREFGTGAEFVEDRQNDPFLRPRDPSREHPIALRLFAFEF